MHSQLDELLVWLTSQVDIRVTTLARLAEVPRFGADTLARNRWYMVAAYLLPPALKDRFLAEHVYLDREIVTGQNARAWGILLALYGLVFVAASLVLFLAGKAVFDRGGFGRACKYAWPLAACALAAWAIRSANRNYRGAIVLAAVLGACLGWLGALWSVRKRRRAAEGSPPPTPKVS